MKRTSRFLSLLLAFVMLVGMLPMSVLADETGTEPQATEETQAQETTAPVESPSEEPTGEATEAPSEEPTEASAEEETTSEDEPSADEPSEDDGIMTAAAEDEDGAIYVLAGSDWQYNSDNHTQTAVRMKAIMTKIKETYSSFDGFLFAGDYNVQYGSDSSTNSGINAFMSATQEVFSELNHTNSILVQGNHDTKVSNIDATGGHDFTGYSVYVLNEDDYPAWDNSDGNGNCTEDAIKTLASDLETWLNAKIAAGDNDPIFVTAHIGLSYTTRTAVKGDGQYAKYIFDVLNEAGKDLTIVYLFGHNHSSGYDEWLGGEAIYLPVGDTMPVAEVGETDSWTTETLNFTYMNAGYVGYYDVDGYTGTGDNGKLTMTVFKIEDGKITVERYNDEGLYNLKCAGDTTGTYASKAPDADTQVWGSPQTITRKTIVEKVTKTDASAGISVTAPGLTGLTVTKVHETAPDGYSVYVSYDITPEGYTQGDTATVTVTVPDSFDATRSVVVIDQATGTVVTKDIVNGTVTFTTDHFSTYDIGQFDTSWVEIPGTASEWVETTSLTARTTYILMGTYADGSVRCAMSNTSDRPVNPFDIYNPDAGANYMDSVSATSFADSADFPDSIKWEAVASGVDGYVYLKNLATGRYLRANGEDIVTTSYTYSNDSSYIIGWSVGGTYNGLMGRDQSGDTTYYARYSDSGDDFVASTSASQYEEVRPYVLQGGSATTRYAKLEGTKSYMVAEGATEAEIIAAVQAGITGYVADDATGTNKTALSDSNLTWAVTGDATNGYVVTVSYQGIELGSADVAVNVVPGTGSTEGWVQVKDPEGGNPGTTTWTSTYTLDTDGVNPGENYLIVGSSNANAMTNDGTDLSAESVTIDGSTVKYTSTTSQADCIGPEWTISGNASSGYTIKRTVNGTTYYLVGSGSRYSVSLELTTNASEATAFTITNDAGQYTISYGYTYSSWGGSGSGTGYLHYSTGVMGYGAGFEATTSDSTVRLYGGRTDDHVTTGGSEGTPGEYAKLEGITAYTISVGSKTEDEILAMIQAGLTVYTNTSASDDGRTALEDSDSRITWTWNDTIDPDAVGNYQMTVSCDGKPLGTVNVCIQTKAIKDVTFPTEGYVQQYSAQSQVVVDKDGNPLKVKITYEDDTTDEIPLTLSMLTPSVSTKEAKDITGLTVTYAGMVNDGDFTLHITEKWVNNYPEYPNEGAVKVNKTAEGIDFQSSGVAQVELSASGVPVEKGADVIIMLDTSSSMTSHNVTGTSTTRAAVLEESLKDLIAQFKENGPNGEPLDIRVAIADFNGFYGNNHSSSGTPYDRDADDMMSDDIYYNANSEAKIYTGDGTLGAGAFVQNTDLANSYTLNYTSGTNYDYAMDAIYQLGYAIQQQNAANGEERNLFVIFMSDGAAMQWNYYHSQGASELWNEWITGTWDASDLTTTNLNCVTHKHYYDEVDHDGDGMYNEHRMANAIKGATDASYEVIRKTSDLGTPTGEENMYIVPGLGATMFSISFDATTDTNVLETSMDKSIASLASDQIGSVQYYYKVTSADELDSAFTSICNEIAYAASNAVFKDQMGDAFSLQMSKHEYKSEGSTVVDSQIIPTIEVLSYDIYTRSEWVTDGSNADTVNTIGTRQDSGTVTEAVIFSDDGTKAYSTLIDVDKDGTYGATANSDGTYTISDADDNILGTDGVIYAQSFLYNTTNADMTITVGGKQITVAAESFYWNLGTVTTTEQALRYYVYLDGSMEGQREAGSYATNNYATLYYDNYLGNPCEKPTVSPSMAWESANVSYAFYLVDENGNVIVNQTTGFTGSFANKIAVTSPVVYEEIYLNNLDQVSSIEVASLGVLPEGYELYDSAAKYTVTINSNATGSWAIVKSDDKVASTYVTQYGQGTAYSNATSMADTGNDYTHTVVWFAVVWKPQALPDTVVIDYGLPVDIHMLTNDMFGDNGTLAGIAKYDATAHDTLIAATTGNGTTIADGFGTEATGTYGTATATVGTGIVRYQVSDMNMSGKDVFTYAVNYTGTTNAGYYYDTVTVIPATTIYYEDSFLEFAAYDSDKNLITEGEQSWAVEGTTINATQGEDRPGEYSLPEVDANNVYGYDGAYTAMTEYSMGSARKIKVVEGESYGTAKFTFTGTGFDIVSLTSNTTGTIMVDVYQKGSSEVYRSHVVDSYYGYTYNETDGWVVSSAENSLYQVPVMKIVNLPYGSYDVTITAIYSDMFHHGQDGADKTADGNFYWFYLDAIRIYDPANDGATDESGTITDAYVKDNEGWPEYHELRNKIISQDNFNSEVSSVNGVVYIDGQNGASIADYTSYGPNNELYLTTGNAVAFKLGLTADQLANVADVQIGVKSADGKQVIATCFTASKAGVVSNEASRTITTTTDMYYSAYTQCTASADGIVVLKNTGEGIMSITNIKITYKSDPNAGSEGAQALATFAITPEGANYAVMALSLDYEEPDVETPTEPEVTEPEVTEPEATEPEIFEPETFEPETFDVRVDNSSVKVGSTVRVTVTTSDDVDHLVVNGETITWYRTNRGQGTRTWTVKVSADTVGELPIEIVAYNASGVAAAAFTETVTVTAQFTNIQNLIGHIVDGLVRKWF